MKYMVAHEAKDEDLKKVEDLFDMMVSWKRIRSNHWVTKEFGHGAINSAENWLTQYRWTPHKYGDENVWTKGKHRISFILTGDQAHAYLGM